MGAAAQYRGWQLASAIIGRLPLRMSYALAVAIGSAAYHCWPGGRRAMHANFRRVLPEADRRAMERIARESLVNYCRYLVDFIRSPRMTPAGLIAAVHEDGEFAALDAALADGRGAVVVCMHFGNWDFGAGATAARGYPLTVVVETFADARLDRLVVGARGRLGMKVARMEHAGPSLLRTLKANGVLALLVDRPLPDDGVPVTFFGRTVHLPAGPARLALRSGARVIPTAFVRLEPHRPDVRVLCDFSITNPATGDRDSDVQALTQAVVSAHEQFIRQHPAQWYMFRRMWPATRADRRA